jgi:hypothetical protein
MASEREENRLAELAYELALRALDHQDGLLDELRARTGTLLAAASIVASFLGATAIDRGGLGFLAVGALVAFVMSIGASVYVLLPKRSLVFSINGPVVIEEAISAQLDLAETYLQLAYWTEDFRSANVETVNRLFTWYRVAVFALLAEVCLWAAQLGGTI